MLAFVLAPRLPAAEWTVDRTADGVAVLLDGELMTKYLVNSGAKPVLWPVVGPTGKPYTRAYPLKERPGEKHDHPHHRSLWFTHGKVNGTDFWSEERGHGTIEHREFVEVRGGADARIVTRNDWLDADGQRQCEDERRLTFRSDARRRTIDFDITLKASDGPVEFGDTKEGSFGIRVASSMDVDAKRGGRIINSEGQIDDAAWAKRAAWVDYHGPVDGSTVGIAVLNHPSSFRYPTYWHVRTYGLFAANPFGVHSFIDQGDGSLTLQPGQSLSLCYRVVLHGGDEKEGRIAEAFAEYAAEKLAAE